VGFFLSNFLKLGISENLAEILKTNGITLPTPIQEQAIPAVMDGQDVIAQAQTGTGKTFAFVLPILEKIDPNKEYVQALIVTPTRELALQITNEIEKFLEYIKDIRVLAVYGGQDVEKQLNKLRRNVQIVVGTPGRLLDHIRRETVQLSKVSMLVLDEADQMLHIGFLHEVEEIINETPISRQTMLFSATIPDDIRKLAKKHMELPKYIQVEKTQAPAMTINQVAIHTTDRGKQALLMQLVEKHQPFLAVIFCRTKRRVSKLYDALKANGFQCDELHGDLSQAKRERVMERFRNAEMQLLVATDVAARGLDVEGVTHVYNYDIPQDTESYIHRIGRTGRAGSTGLAITLYADKDRLELEAIEKDLNIKIEKQDSGIESPNKESQSADGRHNRHGSSLKSGRNGRDRENRRAKQDSSEKTFENRRPRQDRPGRSGEARRPNRDRMERTEETGRPSYDRTGRPGEPSRPNRDRIERPGKIGRPNYDRTGRPGEARRPSRDRMERPGEARRLNQDRVERPGEPRRPNRDRMERPGETRRPNRDRAERPGDAGRPNRDRAERPGEARRSSQAENHSPRQGRAGKSSNEWSTSSKSSGNRGPKRGSFAAGNSKKRK
jgi:ATP-dependent RNA helicase DeaD